MEGYNQDSKWAIYWEPVYMLRKVIMVLIVTFVPYYSLPFTILLAIGIVFLFFLLHLHLGTFELH